MHQVRARIGADRDEHARHIQPGLGAVERADQADAGDLLVAIDVGDLPVQRNSILGSANARSCIAAEARKLSRR